MADKSIIVNKQGVAHTVFSLMHEDIAPQDAAEMYEFASPELKGSFIEGLTLGQAMILALRHFIGDKRRERL